MEGRTTTVVRNAIIKNLQESFYGAQGWIAFDFLHTRKVSPCVLLVFILSTDSDYLLNLCNKQVQYLTISPAQSTSAWGHFRKMLDSAPLALRVPLLQARSHSDNIPYLNNKKERLKTSLFY